MELTQEQYSILANVLINPQEWIDNAISNNMEWAITEKIDKYRQSYLDNKDLPGYQTRAEREAPKPLTQEQIKRSLINAIQSYLDKEAQAHFYDGILSLCSYATSTNPKFGPEGQSAVIWRDACWAKGYEILNACEAGTRPIPTVEELLNEMPVMEWPT